MTRDVVVIGSGAGGGPLALRLSQAGWDVLVLEKGPRHAPADYQHDELHMLLDRHFWWPSEEKDPHVLVDRTGAGRTPERTRLGWIGHCVGGGTAHMSGSFYRFHPDDFCVRSRLGPYESVEDWPYGYDELEPYYAMAEREVGVSGAAGTNPFEGPRSSPYPMPPLRAHPFTGSFDASCRALGLHPFPTPRGINSTPHNGRPGCAYCDFCVGYGCPTGARSGTHEALLPRAEATGHCEVRPDSMVREITVGPDGRATGCVYLDAAGNEHRVHARVVCVCCSAVESARLLLLSKSPLHPDGLANGTGLVGRHLQFHGNSAGRARFRDEIHPGWRGARPTWIGRSVMDHYFLPPGISPFSKGGLHRFDVVPTHPLHHAYPLAFGGRAEPVWGEGLKQRLHAHFREEHAIEFEVFHDFIPNDDTFVELAPEVTDQWGLPAARIHLNEPEHHRLAGSWLVDRGLEILDGMGAEELVPQAIGRTARVMAHGTCRAGSDPRSSVVDSFCRTHEVPNLFVVDGSFMPTSGGAPSTLSILANSFRTADYLIDRASAREIA